MYKLVFRNFRRAMPVRNLVAASLVGIGSYNFYKQTGLLNLPVQQLFQTRIAHAEEDEYAALNEPIYDGFLDILLSHDPKLCKLV